MTEYNIIGQDTTWTLHKKNAAAGWKLPREEETNRIFKDSKGRAYKATRLLKFRINLTGELTPIEVHLVPGQIPLIRGRKWMTDNNIWDKMNVDKHMVMMVSTWTITGDMASEKLVQ